MGYCLMQIISGEKGMDYRKYYFSVKELIINILAAVIILAVIAELFYGRWWLVIFMEPFVFIFLKLRKKQLINERRKQLKWQFNDALTALADTVSVGFSVENALGEVYKEMKQIYGKDSYICMELYEMNKKISVSTPVENVFQDFAERTGMAEIFMFAQVFAVAKRSGGNLSSLINLVKETISLTFKVEQEVLASISDKRFEQKIMSFVPFAIIIYVRATSPDFLEIMYTTPVGIVVMTVCLIAYFTAIILAHKILNVQI